MKFDKKVLIIPFLCLVFVGDIVLNDKVPLANDSIAHIPIQKWNEKMENNYDYFPQWFPNLFSGMPAYGGYINTSGDPTGIQSQKFFFDHIGIRIWFWLSFSGIGLYYFLKFKNISSISALFGGIAYSLTPHTFGLINAGHNNKIMAVAFIPWIFFAVSYLFQSKSFKSILFLSLVSALQLWMNHPQIVYYTWMFVIIWWIYNSLLNFDKKNNAVSIKLLLLLLISIFITSLMVIDPYLDIFTFQKHSNRGAPSVLDETNETESGTKWDYATQWSFHPAELISFVLPYHFGLQNFSVKNRTNPSEFMKQASYWGYMPFTQSTHYMGLIVLFLPLVALLIRFKMKDFDFFENFLWLISLLFIFIGFGKYLPLFYQMLFDYAPFFSKFRIPSMIYLILIFSFSYLSASSLDYIVKAKTKYLLNGSKTVLGSFSILFLLMFLFGENLFSFSSVGDNRFPNYISFVQEIRINYFNKGLWLALVLSIGLLALVWGFVTKRLKKDTFLYLVLGLLILDLWILDREFLSLSKKKIFDKQFSQNAKIEYMINDSSNFRIFPADDIGSNAYGYWGIQSIGGYRAVKLRNYQDLMDIGGFRRPKILNMLNVKYLITNKAIKNSTYKKVDGINGIYQNLDALPRAWFVGSVEDVLDQKSSLSRLMDLSFRPKTKAVVVNYNGPSFNNYKDAEVNEIDLKPNQIKINCETFGGALLVLSEVYYGPGWKCKIDGNSSKIYQTNHILRSVVVPDGIHEVVFYYDDSNWIVAKMTSRITFVAAIFLVCFLIYKDRKILFKEL
jgi:hypothetical protein